tara:strand:- start:45 stop:518 length:474 start_codon:yes stop_codon:yes gene_type:complete
MALTKNTTITGTVAGMPTANALPNTVGKAHAALWVTPGTWACTATIKAFIAAHGGPGQVCFVHFKGTTNPLGLRGLSSKISAAGAVTTRGNCLLALANGATISAAQAKAAYAPRPGPVQKGRPSITSAYVAWLAGAYNPGKHGGPGFGALVALKPTA